MRLVVRVDRHVLQRLTDPICHLLRNAVAHGIEPAGRRWELNKPAAGSVRLAFEKLPDALRATVEDDGAGLDVEAIRQAAGAGGDPERSSVDQPADEDISELVFRPGLTTQEQTS